MAVVLHCYRCGESLAALTLPLSRLDECPKCYVHLHVCRMCERFAPRRPKGCSEEDAPEVRDKKSRELLRLLQTQRKRLSSQRSGRQKQAARTQLDALFKK